MHVSICFKPNYVLLECFEVFILVVQQTIGLYLLCLFLLVMLICTADVCFSSLIVLVI